MDKILPAAGPVPAVVKPERSDLRERLGARSVVLVGLMGAGKSTIGRRLASHLGLPFHDADVEIESAAGMPIPDIFANFGEPAFRDGERRVIGRLLEERAIVLATGGGAYMNPETRARIAERAVSVWLKADHATLMRRVSRRSNRPLLRTDDPNETMRRLMAERYPVYALADITVESRDAAHQVVVHDVVRALEARFPRPEGPS